MKTVFINGSPKRRSSASGYFMKLQAGFLRGQKVFLNLRTKQDHGKIFDQLLTADAVVFSLPLYVDSLPSHVLAFLREMEAFCRENRLGPKVYAIANNGFIEGRQNAPLFAVLENFCARCRLFWGGGLGIGGGVMFNTLKTVLLAAAGVLALGFGVSGLKYGNWFPVDLFRHFLTMVLLIGFFHLGVLGYMVRLGRAIGRGWAWGVRYTRVLLPSFLFILVADLFFLIRSLFQGGLFRGWLKRK